MSALQQIISGESIIKPKQPGGKGWVILPKPPDFVSMGYEAEAFEHPVEQLTVISAVEVAKAEPGERELGPEYHISISSYGGRCTTAQAVWALNQFDLNDATEDNHVPSGLVRNFWRPVADNLSGYECPCKDHEPAMKEDNGDFVWRGITK